MTDSGHISRGLNTTNGAVSALFAPCEAEGNSTLNSNLPVTQVLPVESEAHSQGDQGVGWEWRVDGETELGWDTRNGEEEVQPRRSS